MNKIALVTILVCFSSVLLADANIAEADPQKTYLLTAPGTLSGAVEESQSESLPQANPARPADTRWQPRPYRFVGDDVERFPQHGQQQGYNNPWTKDYAPYATPANRGPYGTPAQMENPWHVEGDYSSEFDMAQPGRFPFSSSQIYSPGLYEQGADNYSGFRNGMNPYNNPAAVYPPVFNDYMPGLGGDSLGLPFMPFGRF